MPRSANQKLKLLYLKRLLLERSDEEHPLTVADMIKELAHYGIAAERKAIYDDLEALRLYGLDIVQLKGKSTGYYISSRDFELPELKLLVDSVQSSKFITRKKTLSLIKKIEGLTNIYDAQLLQRQVYVRNRVKSMNESVYYNVDEISAAIAKNRKIRFRYFEYMVNKRRRFRKDGGFYEVSPFALMCDDENYYLLAYDSEADMLKHYRVDKMMGISIPDSPREGEELFRRVDMSSYSKKIFGMFTGKEENVALRFENHLVGAVLDRLGRDISVIPDKDEHFLVRTSVAVSPQFFAWVTGFGAAAQIMAPERVVSMMREHIFSVAKLYEKPEKKEG
ncbi:MAG: WYL domain-containing protein [Firmicutes bacterium]|nr:WYL domain-containing protein [Bacillota bacterium]